MSIDELCINTIRMLSVDMVEEANSGHPGMPMGSAPMAYILWTRFLKHNPKNPKWHDRDRFVLSAGHGSALLYSLLHLTGYDLSIEEIKRFRQWGSKTPGHIEYGDTPGVECTTGPLGQGFGMGVGMAIAERFFEAKFNQPGHEIVNHFTYAIVSDGDLMEGIASEAASLAGHLKLGKLIYLYDNNQISLSGETKLTFTEDVCKRFEAYGWHIQNVEDGNDIEPVSRAVKKAREETERPSLISVKTHIGYGSPHKQDTFKVHGSPLGDDEVTATKKNLGWPLEPKFYIPEEALAQFRKAVDTGARLESEWEEKFNSFRKTYPEFASEWENMMNFKFPDTWDKDIPVFPPDPKGIATRSASGKVMNEIANHIPSLIGGSADLNPSTNTELKGKGNFQSETRLCEFPDSADKKVQGAASGVWGYGGANIAYGVREHAMGSISNGMALHGGLIPFAGTFLIFSDYMRPAVRLAALMKLHVIYVFTHDSIALGEDGPTHQPIEHLASLRAMPGLTVIRPADANEAAEAWKIAVMHRHGPFALIFTRQNVPVIDRDKYGSAEGIKRGGYILADSAPHKPEVILIATGSEAHIAVEAYERLKTENIKARVVNLASWELFEEQSEDYKNKVLPRDIKARVSIEAGSTHGWHKYIGLDGIAIGIDHFGASAPGEIALEKFGFTTENVINKARERLGK
ncbi:MAG: transketolase [Nitrospirae bacterium RBG_16_43_8]|nr:MAG: transketolase [Nitrospirae bacterium RBG_16_43_8]